MKSVVYYYINYSRSCVSSLKQTVLSSGFVELIKTDLRIGSFNLFKPIHLKTNSFLPRLGDFRI